MFGKLSFSHLSKFHGQHIKIAVVGVLYAVLLCVILLCVVGDSLSLIKPNFYFSLPEANMMPSLIICMTGDA